jgi:aminopeptidase N
MSNREFKFYPEDFGDLSVKVKHMDLEFDMYEDHTVCISTITFETLKEIKHLDLNAKNLEILEVSHDYQYLKDQDILRINFADEIPANTDYSISTKTICRPTSNILEGLYYDQTPKGCPCTQITQCQQWGFQRIVPCIDDMTAKCTYKTTITADSRYTNLLSNGDVSLDITQVSEGRSKIVYDNLITPMATYLFFLGVGTYQTFTREFEYPNGDTFMLELLIPPGSDEQAATFSLQVLHDCIMWVYLFTGKDKYKNTQVCEQIKDLIDQREELKLAGKEYSDLANQIADLSKGLHFGYKYTGSVYREIGMQNSDYGGMENVGNTTITMNRIMPFKDMTDGGFEYMVAVKVHEFYHNLNGSEVTGRSPFEIWLNEAVTVFIEQEYSIYLFGEEYERLSTVLGFLAPTTGTFAGDDSVTAMPIEPDGFNDPNELITGVTYVKAPEFVRMVETKLGKEKFVEALELYHTRYRHSNASRAQWVECMSEVHGEDLSTMAQAWLKQASYPKISVSGAYNADSQTYVISGSQTGFSDLPWQFPFTVALLDSAGREMAEQRFWIDSENFELTFEAIISEPFVVSYNRNYSAFAKVQAFYTVEQLEFLVLHDSDVCSRYMAFYQLSENLKMQLLQNPEMSVDPKFVDLYLKLLSNRELRDKLGTVDLANFESVEDPNYKYRFDLLYKVNKKIRRAIAESGKDMLCNMYSEYLEKDFDGGFVEAEGRRIKARAVSNLCLGILAELDEQFVWDLIKTQYQNPKSASSRVRAFSLYLNSSAPDKLEILDNEYKYAKTNLVAWETFLYAVAANNSDDHLEIIKRIEKSDNFRIDQANDQRGLFVGFAYNQKNSLLTKEGRDYLSEKLLQLSKINEYSTGRLLRVFGNIDRIELEHAKDLIKLLLDVQSNLDKAKYPSVYNTISRIVKGSPVAHAEYEKIYL